MKTIIRYLLLLSLTFYLYANVNAQNIIKPIGSSAFKVEQIISMKGEQVVFKRSGTEFDINKKDLEYVIHKDLGLIYGSINNKVENTLDEIRIDTLDISDYKGFLLKEGNKVYIPIDSPKDYERAGALSLKNAVKEYSFWVPVDNIYESHFILEYIVETDGRDNAYYKIISRDSEIVFDCKKEFHNIVGNYGIGSISSNEDPEDNINVAKKLHKKNIVPLYNIIKRYEKRNKYPKCLKAFYINKD